MGRDSKEPGWAERGNDLKVELYQAIGEAVGFKFSIDYLARAQPLSPDQPPASDSPGILKDGTDKDRDKVVAQTLLQESDRGCAIFGAAILHDDLESLLRAFCRRDDASIKQVIDPLFETYAPLSTFAARIQIAYALGLITRALKTKLDVVRRLRNDFAHDSGPLTFDAPHCNDRLRLLITEGKPETREEGDDVLFPGLGRVTRRQFTNRLAFVLAVARMSGQIASIRRCAQEGRDPRALVMRFEESGW